MIVAPGAVDAVAGAVVVVRAASRIPLLNPCPKLVRFRTRSAHIILQAVCSCLEIDWLHDLEIGAVSAVSRATNLLLEEQSLQTKEARSALWSDAPVAAVAAYLVRSFYPDVRHLFLNLVS